MNKNDFKIIHKSEDISNVLNSLHKQVPYSVFIIDKNNYENLKDILFCFLSKGKNIPIYVFLDTNNSEKIPELVTLFGRVNFIISEKPISIGEKINALSTMCFSKYFLTMDTDTYVENFEGELLSTFLKDQKKVAFISPFISNKIGEIIPTIRIPAFSKRKISVNYKMNEDFTQITLYPVKGLAFYNLNYFNDLNGFDESYINFDWQVLDFGLRCWLFGYKGYNTPLICYNLPTFLELEEERNFDIDYKRYFTKAMGIKRHKGRNVLRKKFGIVRLERTLVKPYLSKYQLDYSGLINIFKGDKTF